MKDNRGNDSCGNLGSGIALGWVGQRRGLWTWVAAVTLLAGALGLIAGVGRSGSGIGSFVGLPELGSGQSVVRAMPANGDVAQPSSSAPGSTESGSTESGESDSSLAGKAIYRAVVHRLVGAGLAGQRVTSGGTKVQDGQQDGGEAADTSGDFEPLFVDWEQPDLVLFVTGRQHGYIEPCGCTGLDRAKGGLLRRHAVIQEMEGRGWPVVKLDLGDQVRRTGPQAVIKLQSTYEALVDVLKYDAIGFGVGELRQDSLELLSLLMNVLPADQPETASPFISANVSIFDYEKVQPYRVVERAGRRIGITAVVSPRHFLGTGDLMDPDREIKIESPEVALRRVMPQLLGENCDVHVLLAYVSERESRELVEKFPQFDFVVNEGVEGEPLDHLESVQVGQRNVALVQMGYKSMFSGAIALYARSDRPVQYQKIPLDHRFKDTEEMKANFQRYQRQLQLTGLKALLPNPGDHPSGFQYVGSAVCADCHDEAYDIWKDGTAAWQEAHPGETGPHYRATSDLTDPGERTWVQRHHDPECLSCHVTGWHPQQYFAYRSGYWDLEKDKHLHGSGCENCHGPGSRHVDIENGDDAMPGERDRVLAGLRVTKEQAKERLCVQCHDLDNSPDFDFDKFWPYVEH